MSREGVDRRTFLALGAGALGVAVAPSWFRPRERMVRLTVPVMGTVAEFAVPARHEGMARQALSAAASELRRIEGLMTRYEPTSDVGRFNGAPEGRRVDVSPETAEVVREALAWARGSGGAFDPTLERLSVMWDPASHTAPPEMEAVRSASVGGWRELQVSDSGSPPTLLRAPGSALDLGGIAKGYGVDRAAQVLREHGIHRGLVNVGGDLMALGDGPGGRPWKVGVRDPRSPDRMVATLEVVDRAVATSGDYLRYFEHGGRRYHHILDPRTGEPTAAGVRTLTVEAGDAMTADAAATLGFARGVEEGSRILAGRTPHATIVHSG